MQRETTYDDKSIKVGGSLIVQEDEILEAWKIYFEKLGTPQNQNDDDEHLVEAVRCIINGKVPENNIIISTETVSHAIMKLHSGKATDRHGIRAEHLKPILSHPENLSTLTNVIARIFLERKIPLILKKAYKIAIPKKGKDARIQDNHRGITVMPILGKLIEQLIFGQGDYSLENILPRIDLQFGFTPEICPEMAILIISEAAAESFLLKLKLILSGMDTRKAFDVVNRAKMKMKLYLANISEQTWALIDDLYTGGSEAFKMNFAYSDPYEIFLGVQQGGILSPLLYKLYIHALLVSLEECRLGLFIGTIYAGCPTVADDITLLSNHDAEMQGMLDISHGYSIMHDYQIHPTKSYCADLIPAPPSKKVSPTALFLGDDPLPVNDSFTHMGLEWRAGKRYPDIDTCISQARRTSFALFGAGLYGNNGLDPGCSFKIICTYIVPRLLHGLNACVLPQHEIDKMEMYYRKLLRRVQGLPDSTSNAATYALLGALPLEAMLHLRCLSLLGQIARLDSEHSLKQLAFRQLALYDDASGSWFCYVRKICRKYDIDIYHTLEFPMKKESWKRQIKKRVTNHHRTQTRTELHKKSSLKWLIWDEGPYGVHPVWTSCEGKTHLIRAATTRTKMMTGRYSCGASAWRRDTDSSCPICGCEWESVKHILLSCPCARGPAIYRRRLALLDLYTQESIPPPATPEEMTSALLNGDRYLANTGAIVEIAVNKIRAQLLSSLICHQTHIQRDHMINAINMDETIPYENYEDEEL